MTGHLLYPLLAASQCNGTCRACCLSCMVSHSAAASRSPARKHAQHTALASSKIQHSPVQQPWVCQGQGTAMPSERHWICSRAQARSTTVAALSDRCQRSSFQKLGLPTHTWQAWVDTCVADHRRQDWQLVRWCIAGVKLGITENQASRPRQPCGVTACRML